MKELLSLPKTIAVVGLSDKPERYSYQVANYLQANGFNIVPVNPMIKEVFGLKVYPSLLSIPKNITIDIVDIFRKPEFVVDIVTEVVKMGKKPIIWMQEGVISEDAKKLAEANGMEVIMDSCIMKMHERLSD